MSSRALLLLAIVAVAVIWQLPHGATMLYPFTLLATYAHEMGHGLTALLVGADFDRLVLHADGSGAAYWRAPPGRWSTALVAAGGLLGPSVAGALLLVLARSPRYARRLLAAFAALVVLTIVIWVRNPFGIAFLLGVSLFFGAAARVLPDVAAAFLLHFTSALLCLAWFRDLDYMFSTGAVVGGLAGPSDSAVIADALWLPYWFWGAAVAAVSLALLAGGLAVAGRAAAKATPRS